jgi:hypothetical protein
MKLYELFESFPQFGFKVDYCEINGKQIKAYVDREDVGFDENGKKFGNWNTWCLFLDDGNGHHGVKFIIPNNVITREMFDADDDLLTFNIEQNVVKIRFYEVRPINMVDYLKFD